MTPQQDEITYPQNTTIAVIPEYAPIINLTYGSSTIFYIITGTESYLINCGTEAYGPVISDDLRGLGFDVFTLIVTNDSYDTISGCSEIILSFPRINQVIILDTQGGSDYSIVTDYAISSKVIFDPTYKISYRNVTLSMTEILSGNKIQVN